MKRFRRQFVFWGLILLTCLGIVFWSRSTAVAQEIQDQPTDYSAVATQQSVQGTESASCLSEGQKIDLNNANALAFKDCPGYYPTLAKKIINNGPFETVEEVLNIRGLNLKQKQLLEDKLDFFTVSEPKTDLATRMPPRPMMR